jgi:amidase
LNPRYPALIPGGSSSGSAVAVAAQRVDFAVGTDTGGSIRVPAACCGIYGLKPTYGRVSRAGVHPTISTLDCVGPFARDLSVLERAMTLIDPTFVIAARPDRVRVGLVEVVAEPAIRSAVRSRLIDAGMTITPIILPSFDEAFAAALTIIGSEMWASYGHLVDTGLLGADVQARLQTARLVTPQAVAQAETCRTRFRAEVDALLERVDALALPTLPVFPLTLAEAADPAAALRLTALVRQFNLTGHPAISLPGESGGLPVGLQLVGRRGGDAALCALAHRIVD